MTGFRASTILLVSTLAVTGFALPGFAASASAQEGPAGRYLEQKHQEANRILGRPARTEAAKERRNEQIASLIADLLDYEAVSQAALADQWDERSEEERQEFVSLLRQLVERSYQQNLENTLDYDIRYGDENRRGDAVVVQTTARSRENRRAPAVQIDYRMVQEGNRWRVVDVVTDGVSMVRNYRSQFRRIIRDDGFEGLLARMRSRLEEQG